MTQTTTTTTTVPGLTAGTWNIDLAHSHVAFSVRHLMVSKVRGHFAKFSGAVTIADNVADSSVTAEIDLASIDTNDEGRDGHLRSADFFDVANHPTMAYRSTALNAKGDNYELVGELTLHGVTKPVNLDLEFNGVGNDPWGGTRAGFTATGVINRKDFGIDISLPLDGGGVVVSDKVNLTLEIETVYAAPPV